MSGPQPPRADGYLTLGQIVGAHGVRGGLKVRSFTDPPEALLDSVEWSVVFPDGRRLELELLGGSSHRGQLRVALGTVQDRNAAEALVGAWVQVRRDLLPPLAEREYYRDDLLDFEVINLEGVRMGRVSHFVDLPAGAAMVVRGGAMEHWIPAAPSHLRRVELDNRQLVVDWPETL